MKGVSAHDPRNQIQGLDVLQILGVLSEDVAEVERQCLRFPFELFVDVVAFLPSRESEQEDGGHQADREAHCHGAVVTQHPEA